ncbi:hypothetical protein KQX54_018186 [Cotesia glomerata]|uniref:Uncharacterized protein n=1 Tax=Cotesia glomerata TaxID=32391 RepID=A0AAV7IBQ7_COTGL|nr:hypothetical protein KQX54_018186 [Cotesia glomerata]
MSVRKRASSPMEFTLQFNKYTHHLCYLFFVPGDPRKVSATLYSLVVDMLTEESTRKKRDRERWLLTETNCDYS